MEPVGHFILRIQGHFSRDTIYPSIYFPFSLNWLPFLLRKMQSVAAHCANGANGIVYFDDDSVCAVISWKHISYTFVHNFLFFPSETHARPPLSLQIKIFVPSRLLLFFFQGTIILGVRVLDGCRSADVERLLSDFSNSCHLISALYNYKRYYKYVRTYKSVEIIETLLEFTLVASDLLIIQHETIKDTNICFNMPIFFLPVLKRLLIGIT